MGPGAAAPAAAADLSGALARVSVPAGGGSANGDSFGGAVSDDGRVAAFWSYAANLMASDANSAADVFARLRDAGQTRALSAAAAGQGGRGSSRPTLTADGGTAAFSSDAQLAAGDSNVFTDVYVAGIADGVAVPATAGTSAFRFGKISADGGTVAFVTQADTLVSGDSNGRPDVYVRNRATGAYARVSVGATEGAGGDPIGSGPGHRGDVSGLALSGDGRLVAFFSTTPGLTAGDANGVGDVFLRDLAAGTTTLVSVDPAGGQFDRVSAQPAISRDGRFVAFTNGQLRGARASLVYLYDRELRRSMLVSHTPAGGTPNSDSWGAAVSGDGRYVVFSSTASDLVEGDHNGAADVFVYDRTTGGIARVPADAAPGSARQDSYAAAVSNDGRFVLLDSFANLDGDDLNGVSDVYLWETGAPQASLYAAVAPGSRSVQVGSPATVFGTVLNDSAGTAHGCRVAGPAGFPGSFSFQTTDPATNALTGTQGAAVDIGPGAAQTFLLALTPAAAVAPTTLAFTFDCANTAPAPVFAGVNTLDFSAETGPVPDPISIYSTLDGAGTVPLSSDPARPGFFTVASTNIGASATLTAVPVVGAALPVTASVCETDPRSGVCLGLPGASASSFFARDLMRTFTVFLSGTGAAIPTDYVAGRVRLELRDAAGTVRGGTSVVVLPEGS